MNKTRVMIVDDSSFSRTMLADILNENCCEVVGEAESIKNLIEIYKSCKPDIVTMDIALQGADGFECSQELLLFDPSVKIIMISSMKDQATEATAKQIGVAGYVQKPIDAEHLLKIINNILKPDILFQNLEKWSIDIFKESLSLNITRMTKSTVNITETTLTENTKSLGVTAVIGIIGKYSGTMIVDLSVESAEKIVEAVFKRHSKNQDEIFSMVDEFANVVCGIACSMLNKKENLFNLRVAPPSIFYGAITEIVNPTIQVHCFSAETKFGNINLSVGFKKEAVLWM